jgi:hypothetical protein
MRLLMQWIHFSKLTFFYFYLFIYFFSLQTHAKKSQDMTQHYRFSSWPLLLKLVWTVWEQKNEQSRKPSNPKDLPKYFTDWTLHFSKRQNTYYTLFNYDEWTLALWTWRPICIWTLNLPYSLFMVVLLFIHSRRCHEHYIILSGQWNDTPLTSSLQ